MAASRFMRRSLQVGQREHDPAAVDLAVFEHVEGRVRDVGLVGPRGVTLAPHGADRSGGLLAGDKGGDLVIMR
jgi:hypothetical protein